MIRRALVALALGAGVLAVPSAEAQTPTAQPEPTGITLTPQPGSPFVSRSGTHFEFGEMTAGAARRGVLLARNLGQETESAVLYGADAVPARGGGFGFTPRGERPTDVGAWLRLDRTSITLAGRQTTTIGFQLVVPPGAAAGEHVGGLVLEPAEATSGGGFQVGTRIAVGVYLTVGGSGSAPLRPEITITRVHTPVRDGRICPTVGYRNTGTAVLDPTAEITVDPTLPGRTRRYPAGKAGGVAPGAAVEVELPCVRDVPVGPSEVTIALDYPGGSAERSAKASYWPFSVVAAGLLLLLLLLALLWLFLIAKRRDDEEDDEGDDEQGQGASPVSLPGNDDNGP